MASLKVADILEQFDIEDVVIFENPSYDSAFIGLNQDNIAIYDYDLMVEYLMKSDGMSEEDASDFIGYNTIRALPYQKNAPQVLYRLPNAIRDDAEYTFMNQIEDILQEELKPYICNLKIYEVINKITGKIDRIIGD